MKGDTPVKTGQNRQCIDNIMDYDREHNRIVKSVHHRCEGKNIDMMKMKGQILIGAQLSKNI